MPYCKDCQYLAASGETECRLCGKELAPTPPLTGVAATAAGAAGTSAAVAGAASAARAASSATLKRAALFSVPLAAVLGGAGIAYHYFHSVPTMEEIVPKNAAIIGAADGQWWWNTSADYRAIPEVRDAIRDAEKESGFSLENDIAPWVGQSGVAVTRMDANRPQAVGYLQVRDWPAFFRFYNKVRQKSTAGGDVVWTGYTYHGVAIQELRDKKPQTNSEAMPKLTVSWIKGWVLVGVGDGAVEGAIDTYQGRMPSLSQDPTWAAVLAHRPAGCFAWGGASTSALATAARDISNRNTPTLLSGSVAPVLESFGGTSALDSLGSSDSKAYWDKLSTYPLVAAGSASDTGKGFRFDMYSVAGSDKVKAMWRDIKGTSGGVTGDILARLPKDSNIAFLAHDPAGWWSRYKKLIVAEMPADSRKEMNEALKEAAPVEAIVARYPGDCGIALGYHPGKGFGATLLAQGQSPADAQQSVSDINAYAAKNDVKVKPTSDGMFALTDAVDNSQPEFPLAPVYGARNDFFTAATSPYWADARTATGASLTLPAEARGADLIAMGNFAMLPTLIKDVTPSLYSEMGYAAHDKEGDAAKAALNDTGLETAQWIGYTKISPDGSSQQSTWEISGWDWRAAQKRELKDLLVLLTK